MHRGINQTTASLKIITYDGGSRRETNNSPMNCKRVLMYEGDDNYANVSARMFLDTLQRVHASIRIDDNKYWEYASLFPNHPQIVHHAKILFDELQDLDDNGITVEVADLERYGIVCEPSEYATRGINQLDNGLFSVHFKVKILSGGDLKVIVALWGLSGCGAGTPCPWCFCDSSQFGNWEADINHRYV